MAKNAAKSKAAKPTKVAKAKRPREMDRAFAPIAAAFAGERDVAGAWMINSFGLKTNKKFFVMHWRGNLVVKLPIERVDALVAARAGTRFDPGRGRPMKEWIVVADGAGDWIALAREAYRYVRTL